MTKTIEEILAPKPDARLRIYAWTPNDPPPSYVGLIKVGQTMREDVNERIRQSQGQMQQAYTLHIVALAESDDGSVFRDNDVRQRLAAKGFENVVIGSSREWMRCAPADIKTAVTELQKGLRLTGTHHENFPMRREQVEAVNKTHAYFHSIWKEDMRAVPRFLWNAKMRFGKTFTAYQLARKLGAKRVLVLTFKPAVEDAWQTDLESHADFDGWLYLSRNSDNDDPRKIPRKTPLVYFGSFQDLLGRDAAGNIKAKNEWLHTVNWDLVVFDEYHFGAWRENAKELFEGEEEAVAKKEVKLEYTQGLENVNEDLGVLSEKETEFLPITTKAYLYLSGTPFKALATGEFIEEQIFNWTYTDEQRAKEEFTAKNPGKWNPYGALPQMRLLTYQMPDELLAIASGGEFDEFDLNTFFEAEGAGTKAEFKHKSDVQKWLDIIRGGYTPKSAEHLKTGTRPPFPYSDIRLLPYLQHSFWFLPNVAACHAMAYLLAEKHNTFWHDYELVVAAGVSAGIGLEALPPVRRAIRSGFESKTITLSCGKLTTGVTVPQWSSILMLRNLKSPETYFQAAFRVQSPWTIRNPDSASPNEEQVIKEECYVFDFAPDRALRQIADYSCRLNVDESNPEKKVEEFISFLPVLAYDGSSMKQIDAAGILDMAMSGTTATLLARRWESALLVNVDNRTLQRLMDNTAAMAALMSIEGFRSLNQEIETIINKSEAVKKARKEANDEDMSAKEKKKLTEEEKEYKSKRREIQEKLIKFATRVPVFMYLTDYRERCLKDVISQLEPGLFKKVTGLTVKDFELLVSLGVFNSALMNDAVFKFKRYEDASLSYTGINKHEGEDIGLYDTVLTRQDAQSVFENVAAGAGSRKGA